MQAQDWNVFAKTRFPGAVIKLLSDQTYKRSEDELGLLLPRGSKVVPFWIIYNDPLSRKTGHNQKGTTLEPLGNQNPVLSRLVLCSVEYVEPGLMRAWNRKASTSFMLRYLRCIWHYSDVGNVGLSH